MVDLDFCMSSYLAFRYVAKKNVGWAENFIPIFPETPNNSKVSVKSVNEIDCFLKEYVDAHAADDVGILLSGGIDSAILASYLKKGTNAYTIKFHANKAIDESIQAKRYADYYGLNLKVIDVFWEDYVKLAPTLIKNKKSGLHAVEVALYKAASFAKQDGINKLYCGNGADSTFGGMDKLLSKDWEFDEFVQRYTFVNPSIVLENTCSVSHIYNKYRCKNKINYISFLKEVHGLGIIQSFNNALDSASVKALEPYEEMCLGIKLDLRRIRSGDPKYLLRELYSTKYKNLEIADKIPFARPMEEWLSDWKMPNHWKLKENITDKLNGEQKWLVYCLNIILKELQI